MGIRVYLDTSIYNRQFDDHSQPRVWLESLAFSVILQLVENKEIDLISSTVIRYEISRNPSLYRRLWIGKVLLRAVTEQSVDQVIRQRAVSLESVGIKPMDALHAAAAEAANADYFVTCDDRFLRRYKRLVSGKLKICNPTEFVRMVVDAKEGD